MPQNQYEDHSYLASLKAAMNVYIAKLQLALTLVIFKLL